MRSPARTRDAGRLAGAALAIACVLIGGCRSFHEPSELHMYRPAAQVEGPLPRVAPKNGRSLHLERVTSASHLKERIAWRRSRVEYGYYEDRRWSELPERYVTRELEVELFERRGYQERRGPADPTLSVDVTAFEEVLDPVPMALVELHVRLTRAKGGTMFDGMCQGAVELQDGTGEELARAMGLAMRRAVEQAIAPLQEAIEGDASHQDVEAPAAPR